MDWQPNTPTTAPGLGSTPVSVVHSAGEAPLHHLLSHFIIFLCGNKKKTRFNLSAIFHFSASLGDRIEKEESVTVMRTPGESFGSKQLTFKLKKVCMHLLLVLITSHQVRHF